MRTIARSGKKAWRETVLLVAAGMWLVFIAVAGVQQADGDWDKELTTILRTVYAQDRWERRRIKADKLVELAENEDAPIKTRRTAMLHRIGDFQPLPLGIPDYEAEPLNKTLAACARFRELFGGQNKGQDATVLEWMVRAKLRQLERGIGTAEDTSKTIDDLIQCDAPKGRAVLYRGQLCWLTGENDKAIGYFEEAMRSPADLEEKTIESLIQSCFTANRRDLALQAILVGYGNVDRDAMMLRDNLARLSLDDDALMGILPQAIRHPLTVEYILEKRVRDSLATGKSAEALAWAKVWFDFMPVKRMDSAIMAMRPTLTGPDGDVKKADEAMQFIQYGNAGADGIIGTPDDIANPFAGVVNPLPEAVKENLEQLINQQVPTETTMYGTLKNVGTINLLLSKYDDAMCAWRGAYSVATAKETSEAVLLLPCVLKAKDGNLVRANMCLRYQAAGPAGPDGKMGTADDVANPLTEIRGKLPEQTQVALEQLSTKEGNSLDVAQTRARAFLALGDYRRGLEEMKASLALAGLKEKPLADAIRGIADAINSYDGHVARANQYLLFQKYGATGQDEQMGTADDLANPLSVIEKELGK